MFHRPVIRKFWLLLVSGLLAFAIAACTTTSASISPKPTEPTVTPIPDSNAEIEAALQHYNRLLIALDADGIAAMYTADGELDNSGQAAIKGPQAIHAFLASFTGVHVESNVMTTESITFTNDSAIQIGTDDQKVTYNGQTQSLHQHFKIEWARQPDGRWLIRQMSTY